jgi:deoxyribonuclease-4
LALLGCHVSIEGGVWRAIERGDSLGCRAIQIFTKNQLQWMSSPIPLDVAERFYRAWRASGIVEVVSHASYLINLASHDPVLWKRSVEALTYEAQRCLDLGIGLLVFHPGHHGGAGYQVGMEWLERGIQQVLEAIPLGVRLLLEPSAGQGTSVGFVLKDCVELCHRIGYERLGLCLDTCHLFAAGYDFRTPGGYDRLLRSLGDRGTRLVGCWHLNDSKDPKGSRKDRHQRVGIGTIGLAPFQMILSDPRFHAVPAIVEAPPSTVAEDLALLNKLMGLG